MLICHSCDANSGLKRISPGKTILKGKFWNVEHAYPTSLLGWVVIVLGRHCEELHNLEREEWLELGEIQYHLTRAMKEVGNLEKEYVACFAEKEGFRHIHFHVIPKSERLSQEFSGTKAFHYINPKDDEIIPASEVAKYCEEMNEKIRAQIDLRITSP